MPEFFTSLTYFRDMKWYGLMGAVLMLVGCTSKFDQDLAKVAPYEALIVPSSDFVYVCTRLAERQGMQFKAAEYSEFYIEQFKPTGKPLMEMLVVASHYFEQGGVLDKALKYYQRLANEFPKAEVGKQAIVMIDMLNLGLTTPEAQMEYILKKASEKDSMK
jgi:hypothetical protein